MQIEKRIAFGIAFPEAGMDSSSLPTLRPKHCPANLNTRPNVNPPVQRMGSSRNEHHAASVAQAVDRLLQLIIQDATINLAAASGT